MKNLNPWLGIQIKGEEGGSALGEPGKVHQANDGLNQRLMESMQIVSGLKGDRAEHAVRFKDIEGILSSFGGALQSGAGANAGGGDNSSSDLLGSVLNASAEGDAERVAAQIAQQVRLDLEESAQGFAKEFGIEAVNEFPTSGMRENQIVMKLPEMMLYRWDGGQWTTQLFAGVAPGAVDITKFANGIQPVEIVATLPTTGNTVGRVVLLTTDSKIYRWTGSAWTAAVPAVDVTGQLTDAQIAAVAAAKLTGQITEPQIANGAITDAKIAGMAAAKVTGQLSDAQIAAVAAAKVTGQLTGAQIQDAAIGVAKFAAGLRPVEIVATLPTTGNIAGRVVVLTTDGKLYRWTGSAWTAAVPASDLTGTLSDAQIAAISAAKVTGQITGTQIQDGAISTAKLMAGSVSTAALAAGAVTADQIAANAVTTAKINTGAVTANEIATNAVTAAKIAADAVTAGKVAAGAINAREIAAGAVTTEKLSVLSREYVNPVSVTGNLNGWGGVADDGTGSGAGLSYASADRAIQLDGTLNRSVRSRTFRIDHNKIYRVAARVRKNLGGGTYFIGIQATSVDTEGLTGAENGQISGSLAVQEFSAARAAAFNSSNTYFARGIAATTAFEDHVYYIIGANRNIADCPAHVGPGLSPFVQLPASAAFVALRFLNWDNAGTARNLLVRDVSVTEIGTGQIVADNIAANAITAAKISAGAVETAKIAAGAVTADTIAANAITAAKISAGAVETAKIAAGAVQADQIAAGAVIADKIAANAIDATKIAAGAVTATAILAGSVSTAALAAGAVTADQIAASAVTTAKINTGAVTANEIATNAVTAAKIAADAVTAGKVAAGAINAREIAAGAVTASKLVVSDFSNMVPDSNLSDIVNWSVRGAGWSLADQTSDETFAGGRVCKFTGSFTTAANTTYHGDILCKSVPVEAGKTYAFSSKIDPWIGTTGTIALAYVWFGAAGQSLGSGLVFADATNASAQVVTAQAVAPAGATHGAVGWRRGSTAIGGSFTGTIHCGDLMMRRATSGELIVDGAITADKIAANTITGDKIAANAIGANQIAANAVTAAKISVTSLSAISANLGTIQVGSANIANLAVERIKIAAGAVTSFNLISAPVTFTGATTWGVDALIGEHNITLSSTPALVPERIILRPRLNEFLPVIDALASGQFGCFYRIIIRRNRGGVFTTLANYIEPFWQFVASGAEMTQVLYAGSRPSAVVQITQAGSYQPGDILNVQYFYQRFRTETSLSARVEITGYSLEIEEYFR